MSPSEFDLRSALHDGEGDVPDVEQVLTDARRHRSQRRTRVLSASAAVVVVAGIATGITLVSRSDDNIGYAAPTVSFTHAMPNATSAPPSPTSPTSRTSPPSPTSLTSPTSTHVASPQRPAVGRCPTSFPRTLLPGGGSPGQFGASGPLFARSVSVLVVCSYGTAGPDHSVVLSGAAAHRLVHSLETAAKRPLPVECPDIVAADSTSLALIGVTPGGTTLRAVTTTLGRPACNVRVTNGTAVRYNWAPPVVLLPTLRPLLPTGTASILAPPSATGSPIPRPVHGSPVR